MTSQTTHAFLPYLSWGREVFLIFILVQWSLFYLLSPICIFLPAHGHILISCLFTWLWRLLFYFSKSRAHVLWVNYVIIYVNYVHRSYTLPLGEMQIRTFCILFVFKYIYFSLQGSGHSLCLFSHCSSFVFSFKYLTL